MVTCTLLVLGATKSDLRSTVTPYYVEVDETIMLANPDSRWGAYGKIANRHIEKAHGEVFGMIHADTALSQAVCDNLVKAAEEGVIAGIVGARLDGFGNLWSRDVDRMTEVSTLDACAWFASREVMNKYGLRFDLEMFDSYHCCVEDFCLQASTQGVPVVVVPGWSYHPFPLNKDVKHWEPKIHELYRGRLEEKWRGVNFATT